MDLGLKDKVALVCASSKGLGRATAEVLAEEGSKVVLCARTESDLEATRDDIQQLTRAEVAYFPCDLSKVDQIRALVEFIKENFGRLDILVHNAGGPPAGRFLSIDSYAWQDSVDLNLLSAVHLCGLVIPLMQEQGWGRVIFITSVSVKQPLDNLILSNVTRLGIAGLAKSLANEHAKDGILVNVVCPGPTKTERLRTLVQHNAETDNISYVAAENHWTKDIPMGRLGEPRELANVVAFLASEKASYITGTVIAVDGGFVKSSL